MERLLYGQVGGRLDAFIGDVHRKAIAIDGMAVLAAGCFSSSNAAANAQTGAHYNLDPSRVYASYAAMAEAEAARTEDRLDFVVICTPNNTHYEIAKAFLEAGFHVVCEKPLCFTSAQAAELAAIARDKGLLTCVTYTYTGFNMVKQARQMVSEGLVGRILDVKGEYLQDWLLDKAEASATTAAGNSPSSALDAATNIWRMNPERSGISNCVGDIGTHIEQTVHFVTGLRVKKLCAVLDRFSQQLDLNANVLVEFDGGVHGSFACSQVAAGHYNGLVIRIFGTLGAIEWEEEHPDFLRYTPKGEPTRILTRAAHTSGHAAEINRLPSGHPEGLTIAFANIYRSFCEALLALKNGSCKSVGDVSGSAAFDFPTVEDGLNGVRFVEACVKSSDKGSCWIEC